jgi:anti-sigma factor ChrR (cupin superfamily)
MVNQNFTKRIAVNSENETWHKSPSDGVERLYLERDDGGESAVATTIVRFAPGSKFEQHTHDGGEEFLVLDGVFSDEFGSYPKGTYVRNPMGSFHNPYSESGCVLFVKLRQFQTDDLEQVKINTN